MEREKTKKEIDAANELADYHLNEILESLMPHEKLENGLKEDIRRRLTDAFYSGVEWREELAGE